MLSNDACRGAGEHPIAYVLRNVVADAVFSGIIDQFIARGKGKDGAHSLRVDLACTAIGVPSEWESDRTIERRVFADLVKEDVPLDLRS